MRPIPPFSYHRPMRLEEAVALLGELGDARVIAGGTDLIVEIRDGAPVPEAIVDISQIREMDYIREEAGMVKIGALTTHAEILRSSLVSARVPVLAEAVKAIGCAQIRNRGTIGGNLCNASPAADTAPPLLVLDAHLIVVNPGGIRTIPLTSFFKGPGETVLKGDELLCEVQAQVPEEDTGTSFRKLGRRRAHTLSLVSAAACLKLEGGRCEEARVALGAVAPTPLRAWGVEGRLRGKKLTEE
ncbi:MAG: FAD binding domain-containing protein, partial [Candidatus Bathyarchaeia archaeon]